jgi:hypothetical protein
MTALFSEAKHTHHEGLGSQESSSLSVSSVGAAYE